MWVVKGCLAMRGAILQFLVALAARLLPLRESSSPIDIPSFMGRCAAPSPLDKDADNPLAPLLLSHTTAAAATSFSFAFAG